MAVATLNTGDAADILRLKKEAAARAQAQTTPKTVAQLTSPTPITPAVAPKVAPASGPPAAAKPVAAKPATTAPTVPAATPSATSVAATTVKAPVAATTPQRDISVEINNAATAGDDAAVERLLAERWQKLESNPDLMAAYGNDMYSNLYKGMVARAPVPAPAPVVTGGTPAPAQAPVAAPTADPILAGMQQQMQALAGQYAAAEQRAMQERDAAAAAQRAELAKQEAARLELQRQYEAAEKQQAEVRSALEAAVQKVASPENFQSMLAAAMQQIMPQFDVQKREITEQYQQVTEALRRSQEQRGVFSAGFSQDQERKTGESMSNAVAKALADLQASSVGETRQNINQQLQALSMRGDWGTADAARKLQGIGMQGDWLSDDTQTALQAIQKQGDWSTADASRRLQQYGTEADIAKASAEVGLDLRAQDIQQSQFAQTYSLDRAKMAQNQQQFNANMAFDQKELAQRADQFSAELDFKNLERNDALSQFAQNLGLDVQRLGLQQAAQASESAYRAAALALDKKQFQSELERQDALNKLADEEDRRNVIGGLYTSYAEDRKANVAPATMRANMKAFAEMYKDDPTLYRQLNDFINNTVPEGTGVNISR